MKKLLTLDLGTMTGWAVGSDGHVMSGSWSLKPSRYDSAGMRFVKLAQRLNEVFDAYRFEIIYFEEVRRHQGVDAAHVYGGLLATTQRWCHENGVECAGVPVGTIKKMWTGKGNASKELMIAEAVRRGFAPVDDNEADALAIFHWALKEHGGSVEQPAAPARVDDPAFV